LKQKNELPVKYPIITSYPEIANLFAVIENNDEAYSWIYNNYVNIWAYKDFIWKPFFYKYFSYDVCPFIDYQKISKDIVLRKWSSFDSFIREMVDSGYYITLYLDQFHITYSSIYQQEHDVHPTLIYGYNTPEGTIKIADFYNGEKYSFLEETVLNINNAFTSPCSDTFHLPISNFYRKQYLWTDSVIIFRLRNDVNYSFNKNLLINLLKEYVEPENMFQKMNVVDSNYFIDECFVWDINTYKYVISYLNKLLKIPENIPPQLLYIHLDHKKLMIDRLKYLINTNQISNSSIQKNYTYVAETLQICINLIVKYNVSKDKAIIQKLIDHVQEIIDIDRTATYLLISELEK
jgi:hypothetical protein